MKNTKIAIIGTGNVGKALGLRLANLDHKILYGTRDPSSRKMLDILQQSAGNAEAVAISEAVKKADVVILAVPWEKAQGIIKSVADWEGKILVDCTNALNADLSGLTIGPATSAAEEMAGWAKGAAVVKAFNSVGTQIMANPQFGTDKAVLFICGNDTGAKRIVKAMSETLGFDVQDAGELKAARYLEQMAMFWIHLAIRQKMGSDFAFKLLRR